MPIVPTVLVNGWNCRKRVWIRHENDLFFSPHFFNVWLCFILLIFYYYYWGERGGNYEKILVSIRQCYLKLCIFTNRYFIILWAGTDKTVEVPSARSVRPKPISINICRFSDSGLLVRRAQKTIRFSGTFADCPSNPQHRSFCLPKIPHVVSNGVGIFYFFFIFLVSLRSAVSHSVVTHTSANNRRSNRVNN